MDNRRLPPFGKLLLQRQNKEHFNEIHVFIGKDCWRRAKSYVKRPCLVLPPNEKPSNFDWSVVKSKELLLWITPKDFGMEMLRSLAFELLKAGGIVVRAVSTVCWKMIAVYRQGGENVNK
jgi:hypothetical protein